MTSGLETSLSESQRHRPIAKPTGLFRKWSVMIALLAGAQLLAAASAGAQTCTAISSTPTTTTKTQGIVGALSSTSSSTAGRTGSSGAASRLRAPACVAEVPNVVSLSPARARSRLASDRLQMSVAQTVEARVRSEQVARQTPKAGTKVACGCEVAVVVAKPQEPRVSVPDPDVSEPPLWVTVPGVIGHDMKRAIEVLRQNPLSVKVAPPIEFKGVTGVVARQYPRGGSKVAMGTVVMLWLKPASVAVPRLVGRTPETAGKLAQDAGLTLVVTERRRSTRKQDTVAEQSPRPGTRVAIGSRVAVEVELAQEMVRVPDVFSQDPEAALGELGSKRLNGRITERTEGEDEVDRVIGQIPAPGTWVPVNTTVRLAVALARPLFPVPDVRGLAPAAAAAKIAAVPSAGFSMSVVERRPSDAAEDRVARQSPAPGRRVPAGTPIEVRIDLARVVVPPLDHEPTAGLDDAVPPPPVREPSPSLPEKPVPPEVEVSVTEPPVTEAPLWRRLIEPLIRPATIGFGALLLALFLLSQLLRQLRRLRKRPGAEAGSAAAPHFEPHADPGVQQIELTGADAPGPEIRLQANSDPGIQSLEIAQPDLFEEERRYA